MDNIDVFIKNNLDRMGLAYDEDKCGRLCKFVSQIELFNPAFKLVGDSGKDIWIKHVFDSLSGCQTIEKLALESGKKDFTVADLGSGAGFPGIPLAIMLDNLRFTLIERMQRRVGFLRNALAVTGLYPSVGLIDDDIRNVKKTFDLVVMRAFHPLSDIASDAFKLLADGGAVLAYKATDNYLQDELEDLNRLYGGKLCIEVVNVNVPQLGSKRKLCVVRKPND